MLAGQKRGINVGTAAWFHFKETCQFHSGKLEQGNLSKRTAQPVAGCAEI
jgi:hypothetical protein